MVEDSSCGDRDGTHHSEGSYSWQTKNQPLCTAEVASLPLCSAGQPRSAKRKRSDKAVGGSRSLRPILCRATKRKLVFDSPSSLEDHSCSNTSDLLSQSSRNGFQSCKTKGKYVSHCWPNTLDFLLQGSVGHTHSSEEKRDVSFEQSETVDCRQESSSDVSGSTVKRCIVKQAPKQNRKRSACRVLQPLTDCTRISKQEERNSTRPSIANDPRCESSPIVAQPSGRSCGCSTGPSVAGKRLHGETSVGKPDVVSQLPVHAKKAPGMSGSRWGEVPPLKNFNTILSGKQIKRQLAFTGDILMDFKLAPHTKSHVKRLQHSFKWPNQAGRSFSGPLLKLFQRNLAICRSCEDSPYIPDISMDVSNLNLSLAKRSATTMGHRVTFTKCCVHDLPIACLGLLDECSHVLVYH